MKRTEKKRKCEREREGEKRLLEKYMLMSKR
jgi:hypothetical protein